jgi:hypothetical protein
MAFVEAAIEGPKLAGLDLDVQLESEVRNRLAQIAIVVHDLVHAKAVLQQLPAVQSCGIANLPGLPTSARRTRNFTTSHRLRSLLDLERLDELVEKPRYPVNQLVVGGLRSRSPAHLYPAPFR